MFKNHIRSTFRNLLHHWKFACINIGGLSIGFTTVFLIFLYTHFELSFDSMHSKSDRIYRMVCDLKTPTEVQKRGGPAWAVAPHLKYDFPHVEVAVRIFPTELLVSKDNVKFQESNILYADSAFFSVFDFPLLKGIPETALNKPLSVVFSESAAKKYFGGEDPLGKTIELTALGLPAVVTGIMKDIPENSQIQGDIILSMASLSTINPRMAGIDDAWSNYGNSTYVLLKKCASQKDFAGLLPSFLERNSGKKMSQLNMYPTLKLEKLREVYLYSTRFDGSNGHISNVYIFSIIGIFILLIVCLNYVNLTTARAVEKAREVGVRKLLGARKSHIVLGYLFESVLICVSAFLISLFVSSLCIPYFNQLSGKLVSQGIFEHALYPVYFLLLTLVVACIAGIYPALVLGSFKSSEVLKGKLATSQKGVRLRQYLVTLQYVPSILLIICSITVYKQLHYMQSQDLGFSKNQVLVMETEGLKDRESLFYELKQIPGVASVSISSSVPGSANASALTKIQNSKGEMQTANLDLYFVDFDYLKQFDLRIVAGRTFSPSHIADTSGSMIINETAARLFGYSSPFDALGRNFDQWGKTGMIIGVVRDFHFMPLQVEIKPLVMRMDPSECSLISLKIQAGQIPETLSRIENRWKATVKTKPFSYHFMDEAFDSHYDSEKKFGQLLFYFSIISIFLSAMGILALASYVTTQRSKEISIRKVLGASIAHILKLLTLNFLKLMAIALLIASPVAWFVMNRWLEQFAYKIEVSWEIFAASAFLIVLVTNFTIIYQAIKAALRNPIKSLRI